MTVIFKAKTQEGYIIKVLSELLQNVIKTACLEVTKEGIYLRMMDSHRYILINIELIGSNFNIFHVQSSKTLYLGISLNHLYKMLKSIKKKDALLMHIDDENPELLHLTVYPKENNRISKSSVHIQTIQHINIPLPTGYTNPVIISSGDYQRTLKDMNNIGDVVSIHMRKYSVLLGCSADGIYSREVLFGELDDDSEDTYTEHFDMEQFVRIIKIAGLSKNIQMYKGNNTLPLSIVSNVGQLGTISIYIKSLNQIKMDSITDN